MNKAEKSLRWVVNQIPDFKPTTNEEKMLVAIKLYSEAGAEEIAKLESENAELRARLEKAVELPCVKLVNPKVRINRISIVNVIRDWAVVYIDKWGVLVVEHCKSKTAAEARLAELKGEKEEMTNADRQRNLDRSEEPKGTRIYCDHCGYRYNVKKRDKWEQECFARASDMIRNPCAMAYNRMKRTDI